MTAAFQTLDDADLKGKRVLVRVDLNVPMDKGRVSDATRIERVLPTIKEISDKGGKAILLSHFGRPKGGPDKENSLQPLAEVSVAAIGPFCRLCVRLHRRCGPYGHRRNEGRRRSPA